MTEKRQYKVYCHTFPNGKKYIGLTNKENPEHRWNHGRGYNGQTLMKHAIEKYGWENVEHEILFDNLTKEEAAQKETELIEQYKTRDFAYGYNYYVGGYCGRAGSKLKPEQIEFLKNRFSGAGNPMYGRHRTEEEKQKIREGRKGKYGGKNHPLYGTHRTEETKEKLRRANLGDYKGADHPQTKAVEAYDPETGQTLFSFVSVSAAERAMNACHISECCLGKRRVAAGYHWRFSV